MKRAHVSEGYIGDEDTTHDRQGSAYRKSSHSRLATAPCHIHDFRVSKKSSTQADTCRRLCCSCIASSWRLPCTCKLLNRSCLPCSARVNMRES